MKELRIKDIPNPVGLINGDIGFTSVLRNNLSDVNISVILPAFGIDMNFVIKGFAIINYIAIIQATITSIILSFSGSVIVIFFAALIF